MTEAETIVRELADRELIDSEWDTCVFCGLEGRHSSAGYHYPHTLECLYKRARDLCRQEALGV